jgi:hypothetical protein
MRTLNLLLLTLLQFGCTASKDAVIQIKNNCFDSKLEVLKQTNLYKHVHQSFADTFATIQASRARPSLLEEKIDDAVFFTADSSKCLLIVLERDDDKEGTFGNAWMFKGARSSDKWIFRESITTSFANDYYHKYSTNTFENISRLARYSVLADGNVVLTGCEIDEHYWFVYWAE